MNRIGHFDDDLALGSITRGDPTKPTVEFGTYTWTKQRAGLLPKTCLFVSSVGLRLTRNGIIG